METKTPELKDWSCVDIDDIENWMPEDPEHVDYWLTLTIGIKNEEGGDNFNAHIVTNKSMSQIENKKHLVVLPYYSGWQNVINEINRIIIECKDINWSGISSQLSNHFAWEYHDYK